MFAYVCGGSVQPTVCSRELCVFSYYTLGVMSGVTEEVATGAEVSHTSYIDCFLLIFCKPVYLLFLKKKLR